jgi:hypothetical protein
LVSAVDICINLQVGHRFFALSIIKLKTQNGLILLDSAVIFHIEGTYSFKPFVDKDDVVVAAMLPVSPGARDRGCKRIA